METWSKLETMKKWNIENMQTWKLLDTWKNAQLKHGKNGTFWNNGNMEN